MTSRLSNFLVIWEHFKVIVDLPIMLLIMTSQYVIVSINPEKKNLLKFVENNRHRTRYLCSEGYALSPCATRTIGTLRPDNGDVHENVAQK